MESAGDQTIYTLSGRTAVVTGGAHGIGKSIVQVFRQAGARVCILDSDHEAGAATAGALSAADREAVIFHGVDLEYPAAINSAVSWIASVYGHVDVLVNNAGVEMDTALHEMTAERWDRILAINLRAPFLLTQALQPLFPVGAGSIINISSIHATHAFPSSIAYATSKAGLLALTRNLALELSAHGIRVNAICPGYIDTRLWDEYAQQAHDPEALKAQVAALHPVGRRGLPADVAHAALYLASAASAFTTGTHLVVDGGLTIRAHP